VSVCVREREGGKGVGFGRVDLGARREIVEAPVLLDDNHVHEHVSGEWRVISQSIAFQRVILQRVE